MSESNILPMPFVLQGRMLKPDIWLGSLEPVKDTLFYLGELNQTYSLDRPILAKSDAKGLLFPIMDDGGADSTDRLEPASVPLHFVGTPSLTASGQTFSKVPLGAVSYLASGDTVNWQQALKQGMDVAVGEFGWKDFKLKLQRVPLSSLRSPKKGDNSDDEYGEWYTKAQRSGLEAVYGYVLPKVRAVIFVSSMLAEDIDRVEVNIPNMTLDVRALPGDDVGRLATFVLEGDEEALPPGIYEIKVTVYSAAARKSEWGAHFEETLTYTLKERVRFDIKNELGEFSIVLIDPISVEEALINQFPKDLSHLLKLANDSLADGKFGDAVSPSKGLSDYVLRWSTLKQASEFAHSFATFPLTNESLLKSGVGFINSILRALDINEGHPTFDYAKTVEAGVGAGFAWKSLIDAANSYDNKAAEAANAYAQHGLARSSWKNLISQYATADFDRQASNDFADTIAGKVVARMSRGQSASVQAARLEKTFKTLDSVGKKFALLGTATSAVGTAQSFDKLFLKARPQLATAKKDFGDACAHYHALTQRKQAKAVSQQFAIEFEYDSDLIQPQYNKRCQDLADQLLKFIEDYEGLPADVKAATPLSFTVCGHTCDLGGAEYNMALSKRRASSVKRRLAQYGVPEQYLEAKGFGQTSPVVGNLNETYRRVNRRVEMIHSSLDVINAAPSREGINRLEAIRSASVTKELGVDEATAELLQNACQVAVGALSLTPIGPAVAMGVVAVEVAGATYSAVKSLAGVMDEAFNDSLFTQLNADRAQLSHILRSSGANIELMEAQGEDGKKEEGEPQEVLDQFRLRAEALNGLVYLLILSAMAGKTDAERQQAAEKRYRVKEYIQNYILNDQWIYRAKTTFAQRHNIDFLIGMSTTPPQAGAYCSVAHYCTYGVADSYKKAFTRGLYNFNLGLYWAHVTSTGNDGDLKYWGLDKQYRLLRPQENDVEPELVYGSPLPILTSETPTGHIKANFRNLCPVHQLGDPDFSEFMRQFVFSFGSLRKSSYHFIGVFQLHTDIIKSPKTPEVLQAAERPAVQQEFVMPDLQDVLAGTGTDSEDDFIYSLSKLHWEPVNPRPYQFKQHGRNVSRIWDPDGRVQHDTPISIVIILDKDVKSHVPVKAQLIREDVNFFSGSQIKGPSYDGVARELTEADFELYPALKARPELWKDKFGCIIIPFYQHGKSRIDGLKPLATELGMGAKDPGEMKATDYFIDGHLSNMDYQIELTLADTGDRTRVRAPLWGEISGDETKFAGLPQSIYTSVVLTQEPKQSSLLNKQFLLSGGQSETHRQLFSGSRTITPFIRLRSPGKPATPLMNQGSQASVLAEASGSHGSIRFAKSYQGESLQIQNFDWTTPVEFVLAVTSASIHKESYEDISQNWRRVGCSVTIKSKVTVLGETGPTMTGVLQYCGEVYDNGEGMRLVLDKFLDNEIEEVLLDWTVAKGNERAFKDERLANDIVERRAPGPIARRPMYLVIFRAGYVTPKGLEVDSVRPFGSRPWLANSHLEYALTAFTTSDKGFSNQAVSQYSKRDYVFGFSQPKDYGFGAPWCKPNPELAKQYPKNSELNKFFSSDKMTDEQLKRWMEEQSSAVEFDSVIKQAIKD